jgi:hypothetical protein
MREDYDYIVHLDRRCGDCGALATKPCQMEPSCDVGPGTPVRVVDRKWRVNRFEAMDPLRTDVDEGTA